MSGVSLKGLERTDVVGMEPPALGAAAKPSDRWNTDIVDKTPSTQAKTPADFFQADPVDLSIADYYRAFIEKEERSGGLYPRDSALYAQLDRIFTAVVDVGAEIDDRPMKRGDFSFDIARTPEVNAYIYHGEGFKPHVFITTGFLEALQQRYGAVREGHIAMVLGHELKHFIEGHYKTEERTSRYRVEGDPLPYQDIGIIAAKHAAEDFIFQRAFTRDQEFLCDEFGVEAAAKLGYPTRESIEILEIIAARSSDSSSASKSRASAPWQLAERIAATHPGSESRVFRARGIARNLEIESYGETAGADDRAAASSPVALPATLLSLEQRTLIDLQRVFDEKTRARAFEMVKQIAADTAASNDADSEKIAALRTLYILAPACLAIHQSVVPRQPWCVINDNKLDDLTKLPQSRFERDIKPIREFIGGLLRSALDRTPDSLERRITELVGVALPYCGPDTTSSRTVNLIANTIAGADADAAPDAVAAAIDRAGRVPMNLTAGCAPFFRRLAGCPNEGAKHAAEFRELYSNSGRDLRAEILIPLLEDDLLDSIDDPDALVKTVAYIERLFEDSPEALTRIEAALAESVSTWAALRDLHKKPEDFDAFLRTIQGRGGGAHREFDSITAELITSHAQHLLPGKFAGQVSWTTSVMPPGKTRDVVLMRLLEGETTWFASSLAHRETCPPTVIWDRSRDISLLSKPFDIDGAKTQKLVQAFQAVAPHLDLTWNQPTILLGHCPREELNPDIDRPLQDPSFSSVALRTEELGYSPGLCQFAGTSGFTLKGSNDPAANEVRFYLRTMIHLFLAETYGSQEDSQTLHSGRNSLLSFFEANSSARPFLLEGHRGLEGSFTDAQFERLETLIGPASESARFWFVDPGLSNWMIPRETLEGLPETLAQTPPGPARDFLVLYALSFASQSNALEERVTFLRALKAVFTHPERRQALFEEYGDDYAAYGRRLVLQRRDDLTRDDFDEDRCSEINERIKADIRFFTKALSNCDFGGRGFIAAHRDDPEDVPPEPAPVERTRFFGNAAAALQLLSLDDSADRAAGIALPIDRLQRLEAAKKVFSDYSLYLALRCGARVPNSAFENVALEFPEFDSIAAEVGRVLYERWDRGRPAPASGAEIEARLSEITTLLPRPSEQRDRFLLEILDTSAHAAAETNPAIYSAPWVRRIYDGLTPTHAKNDLGRKIYAGVLRDDPALIGHFDAHLELLLDLHPAGSVSREDALKHFIDAADGGGVVRTWAQRDQLESRLAAERETLKRDKGAILRNGALMLVLDAVNDVGIPAKERVDTVLWAIGLRGKSHLVECIELLEGRALPDLKNHGDKLTENEKRELVRLVLAGPQGILTTGDVSAKKEFLDTLFFTVFQSGESKGPENQRAFKAVYDCMLHHLDPHRAAEFLGNFLVSHLDGSGFNEQVKIFFESFDFIGIKTAQYLVSATTLIPDDMRRTLMDLTSRVEGPPKLDVFDRAEKIYGPDARALIHSIGRRVGGGSLMSFYEVTLWDEDRTGPGKHGVIGMLRPDVVAKMPEDLRLVSRLVQTMHEAPELFGGEHVSSDLMDNLARQSLIETNLERTIRLQKKMRADLSGEPHLAVPAVWTDRSGADNDAESAISRGPFIFMDFAPGETLDLYLRRFETTDGDGRTTLSPEGAIKARDIATRIGKVFFEQIAVHGLVHCDLHPGNILIHDAGGAIDITLLDVGLSTELSPAMREAAGRLLKIAVGSAHQGSHVEEFVKSFWYGTGKVSPSAGKSWIGGTINVFESLAGEQWTDAAKQRVVDVIWDVLNDPARPAQARLAAITGVSRELGITLPPEIYYLVRAATITNHLWQHTDWRALQPVLGKLGKDAADARLPDLNVDRALACIKEINSRAPLPGFHPTSTRGYLELAAMKSDIVERTKVFHQMCAHLATNDPRVLKNILSIAAEDRALQRALGLEKAGEKLREILAGLREGDRSPVGRHDIFVSANPLPTGRAAEIGFLERFGSKVRVWDGILHTGTLLRINGGRHRNTVLVVEAPSPTEIHDSDGCLLRPIKSGAELQNISVLLDYADASGNSLLKNIRDRKSHLSEAGGPSSDVWDLPLDEELPVINIAIDFNVVFEDASIVEAIHRRYLTDIDAHTKKVDVEAHARLDKTMEGIRSKSSPRFLEHGQRLQHSLEITARPTEILSLGALLEEPDVKVEIFIRGRWRPIDERLLQTGETRRDYFNAIEQTRIKLGLNSSAEENDQGRPLVDGGDAPMNNDR